MLIPVTPFVPVVVTVDVAVVLAEQPAQVVQGALVPQGPEVQPDQVAAGQAPEYVPVALAWFHHDVQGPLAHAGVEPPENVVGQPVLGHDAVDQPDHCVPQAAGGVNPAPNAPYPPATGAVVIVVRVLPAAFVVVTVPVVDAVTAGPMPPAPKAPPKPPAPDQPEKADCQEEG